MPYPFLNVLCLLPLYLFLSIPYKFDTVINLFSHISNLRPREVKSLVKAKQTSATDHWETRLQSLQS